jgi:oxaloacetate decarboxylase alpha subunit
MKIQITETVLRDGHQSLIATRMSTADMLPIVEKLDEVGYFSLEMWGGATFDVCLRFLNEDPWERLREIKKRIKKTKLQMLLRGQNIVGYHHYPDDILLKFVEKAKENGIDIFRVFDALNDIRNVTTAIKAAKKAGAIVEGAISYTVSPVHTIEKFIKFAMDLKDLGVDIICVKDMAGLISPSASFDLVNHLKKEVKLPVHLHSHCTSGMAPISYLTACEAGVDILDTTMSPFAGGASQPPTETIVGALKGTPFDTELDLEKLTEIAEYFQKIRDRYKHIFDVIAERVDPKIIVHQIPGGMLSNLLSQLKEQKATDKYAEVLKETARVRKDFGYPPLVTPTSQIVGTQAVVNVLTGERYKIIPKEVKDYFRGLYGQPPGPVDEDLKKKVLGSEEPIKGRPADGMEPGFEKAREAIKEYSDKDEDIISYALFPQVARDFFEKRRQGIGPTPVSQDEPTPAVSEKEPSKSVTPLQMVQGKSAKEYIFTLANKKYDVTVSRNPSPPERIIRAGTELLYVDFGGKRYEVETATGKGYKSPTPTQSPVDSLLQGTTGQSAPTPQPVSAPSKTAIDSTPTVSKANLKDIIVPMPGRIVDIRVKPGDKVKRGEILFILEAMKMQNEISSPFDGVIAEITVQVGMSVDNITPLMRINPS